MRRPEQHVGVHAALVQQIRSGARPRGNGSQYVQTAQALSPRARQVLG
jgi:hypothetical protein